MSYKLLRDIIGGILFIIGLVLVAWFLFIGIFYLWQRASYWIKLIDSPILTIAFIVVAVIFCSIFFSLAKIREVGFSLKDIFQKDSQKNPDKENGER